MGIQVRVHRVYQTRKGVKSRIGRNVGRRRGMHQCNRCLPRVTGFRFDETQGVARCSIYLPGGRGKARVRKTIRAANLDEAFTKFAAFRARVIGGSAQPAPDLTLRVYVDTYFDDVVAGLSESTIRSYADVIRNHLVPTFGASRDERLRPSVIPPPPIFPLGSTDVAQLVFVADEAEWDYVIMERTRDRHLPSIAKFPIDHRAARGLTGWTATALDARLARGERWDRVLDEARIRTSDADRSGVLFEPRRFAEWWRGVMN